MYVIAVSIHLCKSINANLTGMCQFIFISFPVACCGIAYCLSQNVVRYTPAIILCQSCGWLWRKRLILNATFTRCKNNDDRLLTYL